MNWPSTSGPSNLPYTTQMSAVMPSICLSATPQQLHVKRRVQAYRSVRACLWCCVLQEVHQLLSFVVPDHPHVVEVRGFLRGKVFERAMSAVQQPAFPQAEPSVPRVPVFQHSSQIYSHAAIDAQVLTTNARPKEVTPKHSMPRVTPQRLHGAFLL